MRSVAELPEMARYSASPARMASGGLRPVAARSLPPSRPPPSAIGAICRSEAAVKEADQGTAKRRAASLTGA
jgi:hypothetical protein